MSQSLICSYCQESFVSKTQLMKHLDTHGISTMQSKPDRVVILFGWISNTIEEQTEWIKDSDINNQITTTWDKSNTNSNNIEYHLLNAIEKHQNPTALKDITERPNFSRSSSCSQTTVHMIGTEPANHGLCDTICMTLKKSRLDTETWLNQINMILQQSHPNIIALDRIILSSSFDNTTANNTNAYKFNAEVSCTQRRVECLIPLDLIMPPDLTLHPDEPIIRKWQQRTELKLSKSQHEAYLNSQQELQHHTTDSSDNTYNTDTTTSTTTDTSTDTTDPTIHTTNKNTPATTPTGRLVTISKMDSEFPIDTIEGQIRINYFRQLKRLLKQFSSVLSLHNFTTGMCVYNTITYCACYPPII